VWLIMQVRKRKFAFTRFSRSVRCLQVNYAKA
jgi:hypothetical protein